MLRLIVLALAAFLVAMVSATGVLVLHHRSKLPAVASPSPSADSASVADVERTGVSDPQLPASTGTARMETGPVETGDSLVVATSAPADGAPTDTASEAAGTATAPAPATNDEQVASAPDTASALLPERRLGKIFGSMQPKEAARVLEQMEDRDVVAILAMLNDRQAAAVLASLPPQRAAEISRLGSQAGRSSR